MTEEAVPRIRRDDEALWVAFAAPLRRFVRRRLPPAIDADDVLQDIFLRIARQDGALDAVEQLEAWIYRVARTAIADALRAHRRREARAGDVDTDDLPATATDEATVVAELTPCVTPFIARLAEPYRSALEDTALAGRTQQEAAARAGISVSGMKSRVQRAREQLRDELLRCCAIQLDVRGTVMDVEVRDGRHCGCGGGAPCA